MDVEAAKVDRATAPAAVEADLVTKERRSSSASFAVDDVGVVMEGGAIEERATEATTTRWFVGAKAVTLADDAARARMAAERCFMVLPSIWRMTNKRSV